MIVNFSTLAVPSRLFVSVCMYIRDFTSAQAFWTQDASRDVHICAALKNLVLSNNRVNKENSMTVRWSGMRIIALPLANSTSGGRKNFKEILPLTYYHFHTPPPDDNRRPTLFNRVTNKAADTWANFGKAHEQNWKVSSDYLVYSVYLLASFGSRWLVYVFF